MSLFFLVVVLSVDFSFLVVSVDDFLVDDFLVVVDVLAGDFSGALVVVAVSVLVVHAPIRPAAKRTVNE